MCKGYRVGGIAEGPARLVRDGVVGDLRVRNRPRLHCEVGVVADVDGGHNGNVHPCSVRHCFSAFFLETPPDNHPN